MTNRFLLKQFAENGDKGVFGSYQAGNKTVSSDPATLQSLTAWTNGWADAISNGSHLPAMEEFQAVQYLICKAVKELYSEGIPVWMEGETYYKGAICAYIDADGNTKLYRNITGNNGVQQPALDIVNWATFSAGGGASAGGQMFDVVQKDHILSFDESKGYVPLGGYAYKEGVSGLRYGYPTFYETCLSEYNNSIDGGYLSSNIEKIGSLTDTLGVLSGFSTSQYAIVSNAVTGTFSPANNTWEICLKITTGNNVSTLQDYFNFKDVYLGPVELFILGAKFKIGLSSNGTSPDIADSGTGTYTVLPNTTYWTKIIFDGTDYVFSYSLDGENFTNDITVTSSTVVLSGEIPTLGIDYDTGYAHPFLGSIDLTQCYIKIAGEYWWKGTKQGKVHANGHIYYDIADKSIVDTLYADTGIAWMYGVDTTSERIALPRRKHGKLVESHSGNDGWYRLYEDGWVEQGAHNSISSSGGTAVVFFKEMSDTDYAVFGGTVDANVNSNQARFMVYNKTVSGMTIDWTNSSYGDPTWWEVKGYSTSVSSLINYYMICGTTDEEVAMTEVTEVTTSENDTIPLFTHKYFEFKPNHISWVPANTVQSGSVYTSAYNTLVDCLTSNPYEIKVIDEADEQVGVDYSEYWIVNQTNETFRTPITVSDKALDGGVKGNGMTLGLTDGTNNAAIFSSGDSRGDLMTKINAYGSNVGTPVDSVVDRLAGNKLAGVTTDSSKSGIIAEQSTSRLYFKVDNAVQNLELIDAGRIEENKLNTNLQNVDLTSGADTIIDRQEPTAANNYTWYRLYKSGWVEQGGFVTTAGTSGILINLPIEMTDTNYQVLGTVNDQPANYTIGITNKTTTSLYISTYQENRICAWRVSGISA